MYNMQVHAWRKGSKKQLKYWHIRSFFYQAEFQVNNLIQKEKILVVKQKSSLRFDGSIESILVFHLQQWIMTNTQFCVHSSFFKNYPRLFASSQMKAPTTNKIVSNQIIFVNFQ